MRAFFFVLAALIVSALPAQAQSSPCQQGQTYLESRKAIIGSINALGKKKVSPSRACEVFGRLVNNGNMSIKWAETNKDWCQIPDSFVAGIKADHARAINLRAQACKAASQQAEMERRARQQAKQQQSGGGGSGLLGGDGLTGQYRIPQGAL
jgi:hypothetical protein